MFTVTHPSLPTTIAPEEVEGGLLAVTIGTPADTGGLIGFVNTRLQTPQLEPVEATLPIAPSSGNTYTVNTNNSGFSSIVLIEQNGKVFTPAEDINNLQDGEFVHDPYTRQVTVKGTLTEGLAVRAIGGRRQRAPLNQVQDLPPIFYQLPLTGDVEWGIDWEGQPGGSLKLTANNQTIRPLKNALKIGTLLNFYGIGFRVDGMTVKNNPDAIGSSYEVTVSLGGSTEKKLEKDIPLRPIGDAATSEEAFEDSECQIDPEFIDDDSLASEREVDISVLAQRTGVQYEGRAMNVVLPSDAQPGDGINFQQELTARLRQYGCFADYSQPNKVRAIAIENVKTWEYGELRFNGSVEVTYQGEGTEQQFNPTQSLIPQINRNGTLPSAIVPPTPLALIDEPDISGLAFEYPNVQLTGRFIEDSTEDDSEDTQGQSQAEGRTQWRVIPRTRETFEEGHEEWFLPPRNVTVLRDLSHNFDASGIKKTYSKITKEDATLVKELRQIWGFAFLAKQIQDGQGGFSGNPLNYWRIIEQTETFYEFDRDGNAIGYTQTGFKLGRFKTENATTPETLALNPNNQADARQLELFEFRQIPIFVKERYSLAAYSEFYRDSGSNQRYEKVKVCLPDGTSTTRFVRDRNYREPKFVLRSTKETVSFTSIENPESTPANPLPRLTTGVEEYFASRIRIDRSNRTRITFGAEKDKATDTSRDRYTEFTSQFSAQDSNFKNSLEDVRFKDFEGRPPGANGKPPRYEKVTEQPEGSEGDPNEQTDSEEENMYLLQTPGYTTSDALGGTENFPHAETLEQALTGAETKAFIEQVKAGDSDTLTLPFNPQLRPGGRVNYLLDGERRRRVLKTVDWSIKILGTAPDGRLLCTGRSVVGMGRFVVPPVQLVKIPLPKPPQDVDSGDNGENTDDQSMGSLTEGIRGRGN